jgi:hypothetical protein
MPKSEVIQTNTSKQQGTNLEREFLVCHLEFIELALHALAEQVRNNECGLMTDHQRRLVLSMDATLARINGRRTTPTISAKTSQRVSLVARMLVELTDACVA